jgi:hypothetical protein
MYHRALRSCRLVIPSVIMTATLSFGIGAPGQASAHWGVCFDDPVVWLNNGANVQMTTLVLADSSTLTHLSFTLHVPPGTSSTRIVNTSNVSPSFESVNVVRDSPSGYVADVVATTGDGIAYPYSRRADRRRDPRRERS